MKREAQKADLRYEIIKCPICKSKTFEYCSYSESMWGIVEQHGNCSRCGYLLEQTYSPVFDCFLDIKKGFKLPDGTYCEKNVKRHKRIRRKMNIKNTDYEINPKWINHV